MDERQQLQFRRLYFAVCDFIGCYEAFLERRNINTNLHCNTAYMRMKNALHDVCLD